MATTYTILSVKPVVDTLWTEVLYNVDGEKTTVQVPHFQPSTKADVEAGITNRLTSESRKITAEQAVKSIAAELKVGIPTEVR